MLEMKNGYCFSSFIDQMYVFFLKKFSKNFIKCTIVCALLNTTTSFANEVVSPPCPPLRSFWCLNPYIGVDGGFRHMDWPHDLGGNLFKKNYPEADFYLGIKFNRYLGIQGGYKVTATRTKIVNIPVGEVAINTVQDVLRNFESKAQFKGWHGEVLAFLPLFNPDCFSLFGSVGFNHFQLYQRTVTEYSIDEVVGLVPAYIPFTYEKKKTILSLGAGAEIAIDDRTNLRLKVGWDNTNRFRNVLFNEGLQFDPISAKNSFTYTIGINYILF